MKCAEYYIEDHKLEVFDSSFGREEILLNGNKISERKSFFGKQHHFKIKNNEYTIRPKWSITEPKWKYFVVRKNGKPLTLVNLMAQDSKGLLFLIVLLGLGLGFLMGIYLYQLFWV